MAKQYAHTCVRVFDPDASQQFYAALGFEPRGRLNFETAYNIYMGLPGDADVLELTVNLDQEEPYELGTGYGHIALTVEHMEQTLAGLAEQGIEPERPPYRLREGGSLPGLVEADDDGLYVVKFRGAGQGPRALVAEWLGGEIARALGLAVPDLVAIEVDGGLGDAEPDGEIQDLVHASEGLNLGVDFLPGSLTFSPAGGGTSSTEVHYRADFDFTFPVSLVAPLVVKPKLGGIADETVAQMKRTLEELPGHPPLG